MIRSQVRRDLHSHTDDKLYQWVCDTVDLYDTAEIPARVAVADIIFSMMTGIGALTAAYDMNRAALFELFKKSIETTHQKYREHTNKESQQ